MILFFYYFMYDFTDKGNSLSKLVYAKGKY